ncbi:ferredoxin reductase family protein [soil metagenome]
MVRPGAQEQTLTRDEAELAARYRRRLRLTDLFEGLAWFSGVVLVALFLADGGVGFFSTPQEIPLGLGIVTGLVGTNIVMIMLLLVARVPLLDSVFGADSIQAAHRGLGKPALLLLIAHAILLIWGYALALGKDPVVQAVAMFTTMDDLPLAFIALGLLVVVVASSLAIVRHRIRHESWYLVHLFAYAAVLIALPHQFSQSGIFAEGTWARGYWLVVSIGTLALIAVFRVAVPLARNLRHRLRVVEVIHEAPGVVSVVMSGRHLERMHARGGQFFYWRFGTPGLRWEGHPYSLSAAPDGHVLRITVRDLGDDSRRVLSLAVGSRVYFEGPYGLFTAAARTSRDVVLIGAGIGITPILSVAGSFVGSTGKVTVILRANEEGQLYLRDEFAALRADPRVEVIELVGPPPGASWLPESDGHATSLAALVPDVRAADVYVCGPARWAELVINDARAAGLRRRQIHTERFNW